MPDDVLASLRPEGGWSQPADETAVVPSAVVHEPEAAQVPPSASADGERWLLACIARGHLRWAGDGTRRTATRSCAHTDDHADITEPVAALLALGHAQRAGTPGANSGGITLTADGRRRLADLERA